jgi:hypothetical protein
MGAAKDRDLLNELLEKRRQEKPKEKLSEQAFQRILAETDLAVPGGDYEGLHESLNLIDHLFWLAQRRTTLPSRKKHLLQAAKLARRLSAFIAKHELVDTMMRAGEIRYSVKLLERCSTLARLGMDWPDYRTAVQRFTGKAPIEVQSILDCLVDDFEDAGSELSIVGRISRPYREDRSPFYWLAGEYLPHIFEMFFETKPKVERDPDRSRSAARRPADGPYIRFADCALRELGIKYKGQPYTRNTIAKALTDAQSGRKRRKRVRAII